MRAAFGHTQATNVEQGMPGDPFGLTLGPLQRGLQAGEGQVVGGGVGFDAVQAHTEHGALVIAEVRGLANVAAHRQVFGTLPDEAQRVEFGAAAQGREMLLQAFDHGLYPRLLAQAYRGPAGCGTGAMLRRSRTTSVLSMFRGQSECRPAAPTELHPQSVDRSRLPGFHPGYATEPPQRFW
ncbi:hypothetical protein FQZ97_768150 [compost metagenome]